MSSRTKQRRKCAKSSGRALQVDVAPRARHPAGQMRTQDPLVLTQRAPNPVRQSGRAGCGHYDRDRLPRSRRPGRPGSSGRRIALVQLQHELLESIRVPTPVGMVQSRDLPLLPSPLLTAGRSFQDTRSVGVVRVVRVVGWGTHAVGRCGCRSGADVVAPGSRSMTSSMVTSTRALRPSTSGRTATLTCSAADRTGVPQNRTT